MPRIPNEIDGYIARRIRQLRILGGFSQKKAAEYLNVTFQQFQKYEAGSNRVSVGKLYLIAEFLDVSPCDLYPPSAKGGDINSSRSRIFLLDEALGKKEIIQSIEALNAIKSKSIKTAIVRLLKDLAKQE